MKMSLEDLLVTAVPFLQTWEEVEASIRARPCLCCGQPGHYQEMMDAHVATNGLGGLAVYISADGRLDGNHRVIAARRCGIAIIPLETKEDAGRRWLKAHGPVGWLGRRSGDIDASEMAWIVVDALRRLYSTWAYPTVEPGT